MHCLPALSPLKFRDRAKTLVEMMVAIAIGSTVLAAGTTFFVQALRSSAAVVNYYDMDKSSRSALSRMTREIREADKLTFFSLTQMQFQITDPNTLAVTYPLYTYDPVNKTLTRTVGGQSEVMLKGCQSWTTAFYQRTPIGGTYDEYPILGDFTRPDLCKVIQLTWSCSRTVSGQPDNTEGVQSAKVVMRKP